MASMVDTVGPLAFSPEKKVPSFNNFSKNHWEIMAHGTSNRAPYPFLFPSMDPNGVPITTTNITRTRWFWTTSFPWIMIRWWNPLFGWLKITLVGEIIVRLGCPLFTIGFFTKRTTDFSKFSVIFHQTSLMNGWLPITAILGYITIWRINCWFGIIF